MDRSKKDLESENEELWQRLEDVYDRLRELFDTNDGDGEAGDEQPVSAKAEVLEFIAGRESVDSWTVAAELGYATQSGAAATLLRLHRHGHLHRRRGNGRAYVYAVSAKGLQWLDWWSAHL